MKKTEGDFAADARQYESVGKRIQEKFSFLVSDHGFTVKVRQEAYGIFILYSADRFSLLFLYGAPEFHVETVITFPDSKDYYLWDARNFDFISWDPAWKTRYEGDKIESDLAFPYEFLTKNIAVLLAESAELERGLALQRAEQNGYIRDFKDRITGCLIGTAVGDSLGLPYEALSRRRVAKRLRLPLRHSFLWGRGMVSDDTEHTVMVARSLLGAGDDVDRFAGRLARQLKLWFLMLPAGIGWGTLRSCLKLLLGFGPKHSGVKSAGNGPAMRSALLGAFYCDREPLRRQFTEASTLITHRDPRALTGALAVAEIAAIAMKSDREKRPDQALIRDCLRELAPKDVEWRKLVNRMDCSWKRGTSVPDFADSLNLADGVTGYIYHTVPVAIYAWYRCYNDFEQCLTDVISCGGDTDTTGAIAGALCGITAGASGIPEQWQRGIWDAPCSIKLLRQLGSYLDKRYADPLARIPIPALKWWICPFRNLFFFLAVACHIIGRLLKLGNRRVDSLLDLLGYPYDEDMAAFLKKYCNSAEMTMEEDEELSRIDLSCLVKGIAFVIEEKKLTAVFLHREGTEGYSEFTGDIPNGMRFTDSLSDITGKQGAPSACNLEKQETPWGAYLPYWVRYDFKEYSIHFTLNDRKAGSNIITLMKAKGAGND